MSIVIESILLSFNSLCCVFMVDTVIAKKPATFDPSLISMTENLCFLLKETFTCLIDCFKLLLALLGVEALNTVSSILDLDWLFLWIWNLKGKRFSFMHISIWWFPQTCTDCNLKEHQSYSDGNVQLVYFHLKTSWAFGELGFTPTPFWICHQCSIESVLFSWSIKVLQSNERRDNCPALLFLLLIVICPFLREWVSNV